MGIVGEWRYGGQLEDAHNAIHEYDREKIDAARADATDAQSKIAALNTQAAELQKQAAELQLENTRLLAIVQPRTIDTGAQKKIADKCKDFGSHGALIQSYGLDTEGFAFGEQIIATLHKAGVVVADARSSTVGTGPMESGIHVRTTFPSEQLFASCVANALSDIGKLKVFLNDPPPSFRGTVIGGGGQSFNPGAKYITVMIGVKPLPLIDEPTKKANK